LRDLERNVNASTGMLRTAGDAFKLEPSMSHTMAKKRT